VAGQEEGAMLTNPIVKDVQTARLEAENARLTARVRALEAALRPFAEAYDHITAQETWRDRDTLAVMGEYTPSALLSLRVRDLRHAREAWEG
jgi:hypothetical protein